MKLRVNLGRATLVGEAIGGEVVATLVGHGTLAGKGREALTPEDLARVDQALAGVVSVVLTPAACLSLCHAFEGLATIAEEQAFGLDLEAVAKVLPAELAAQLQRVA